MFFQHVQVILTLQLAIVCSLQFGIIVISSYSHLKKKKRLLFVRPILTASCCQPNSTELIKCKIAHFKQGLLLSRAGSTDYLKH